MVPEYHTKLNKDTARMKILKWPNDVIMFLVNVFVYDNTTIHSYGEHTANLRKTLTRCQHIWLLTLYEYDVVFIINARPVFMNVH